MFQRLAELWKGFIEAVRALGRSIADALSWWFGGVGELPRQIGMMLLGLGRSVLWLGTLPFLLARSLWSVFARAKDAGAAFERSVEDIGKSVRDTAVDLRESVENQPDSLRAKSKSLGRGLRDWFQVKARWQKGLLVALAAACLVAIVGAYPAWHWFKGWRAERLLSQGETRFEEGRLYEAYFKIQAAYFTDPENTDILARLIDISRAVGSPNTLRFGDALIGKAQTPSASLVTLAEEAQDRRRPDLARAFLRKLEREDPSNPAIPRLQVRSALLRGDREVAFTIAEAALENQPFDRETFLLYASLGLRSENAERAAAVRRELGEAVSQPGERGRLAAMMLLDGQVDLSLDRAREFVNRITEDPNASRDDRIFGMSKALELEVYSYASLRDRLLGEFDLQRTEESIALAVLLFRQGLFEDVVSEFSLEVVKKDRVLFSVYVLSLMEIGRASEGLELVRGSDGVVLPDMERLVLEGRLLRSLGREDAFASTIERAIARADEAEYAAGERLFRQLGEIRFLRQFYEKFSSSPGTRVQSNANLLLIAYTEKDDAAIDDLLRRTSLELLDDKPQMQALLAYLQGLSGGDIQAGIRKSETLVARYPGVLDFRVALAVNYFQAGYLSDAEAILEGGALAELSRAPGMQAVTQAILAFVSRQSALFPTFDESDLVGLEIDFVRTVEAAVGSKLGSVGL